MSIRHTDRESAARQPSEKVRVAAARVRVDSDRQVRRSTPQWIKDLANTGKKQ
ncbi:MAG: hypothetical protein JWL94_893 [Microbacteriaceae bacterium]|jgi:hypothetical protein|nr:hypothetical protein [Microbacteriaceae bacterium]